MKNKALAIRALKKDCEIATRYYLHGKTCAIGCLALLSGIKPREFKGVNNKPISLLPKISAAIKAKFGLSEREQMMIQAANDEHQDAEARRDVVVNLVKFLK